jgi:hypothetical protein
MVISIAVRGENPQQYYSGVNSMHTTSDNFRMAIQYG